MSDVTRCKIPTYRLHKATGQAVVTLGDHDHYLGAYGLAASRLKYDQLIAEWMANGRQKTVVADAQNGTAGITVSELASRFWSHARTYYVKEGRRTSEVGCLRQALRFLKRLYGKTEVTKVGPLALKAVRQTMIDSGLSRRTINGYCNRIKRVSKLCSKMKCLSALAS